MRAILRSVAAVALLSSSCGPDLEDEAAPAASQQAAVIEHETPTRPRTVEWTPPPREASVVDPVQTFQEHFAYTVCSLGICH